MRGDGSETIAAVATAPGRGGVAIVRVSGPDAFAVAKKLTGRVFEPGRIAFATLRRPDPPIRRSADSTIDSCVVLCFKAPRSYTGEDVIEFQCHGGTVTPRRILEACFAAGCRAARRGEFTERAFLNGRMDLSEAESVIELVDARTDRAADDALARLGGAAAREVRVLYDAALGISSALEHALDVDEGELPADFFPQLAARASSLRDGIAAARRRAKRGRLLRDGALVVLAGPPNAGKSSLLNALLGEARAIVSATPGTTRDSIEAWLDIGGWPVRLVDTAGLRETGDDIEREGVDRAEALIAKADLVLRLRPTEDAAERESAGARTAREIDVVTKCDLGAGARARCPCHGVVTSAKTGEGLDALRREIAARLTEGAGASDEEGATPSEREEALLAAADAALATFGGGVSDGGGAASDPVLLANAARDAARALGEMIGAEYSSDVLEALFSRFCVGK